MREQVIEELVEIICPSGNIQHKRKILIDLINRERKASTAIDHGIAIPHVRTIHARDLTLGFAKTSYPIDWDSNDGKPVDLFFVMVSPPYDDKIYLRIESKLASILYSAEIRKELREAENPGEIIRILRSAE
ncbi:PTS sugar transporter subunit IIA [bacterium]|nr:PTS sugar transporter subunit IIA [bacterium]